MTSGFYVALRVQTTYTEALLKSLFRKFDGTFEGLHFWRYLKPISTAAFDSPPQSPPPYYMCK